MNTKVFLAYEAQAEGLIKDQQRLIENLYLALGIAWALVNPSLTMSDANLLAFITSYGTRKFCKMEDLEAQYGSHHDSELIEDLKRLQDQGRIEILGAEVWIV